MLSSSISITDANKEGPYSLSLRDKGGGIPNSAKSPQWNRRRTQIAIPFRIMGGVSGAFPEIPLKMRGKDDRREKEDSKETEENEEPYWIHPFFQRRSTNLRGRTGGMSSVSLEASSQTIFSSSRTSAAFERAPHPSCFSNRNGE